MPSPTTLLAWTLTALTVPAAASAIVLGQLDDFQDGTTQGWRHGGPSPNPPSNVATGGPQGAGDAYLRITALGEFAPGGRLVAFNDDHRWTGDYVAAGVDVIRADVRNPGTESLPIRFGIQSSTSRFVSTEPFLLPGDGQWHEVLFDLTEMSDVGGGGTVEDALADVRVVRVLAAAAPTWQGDVIEAELGVDNIEARGPAVDVGPQTPTPLIALSSRPNPCFGAPTLEIGLPTGGRVTVDVFDVGGRRVISRALGLLPSGVHAVRFGDMARLAPGVWFVRARTAHDVGRMLRVVTLD